MINIATARDFKFTVSIVIVVTSLSCTNNALAGEMKGESNQTSPVQASLPHCVDSENEIAEILAVEKANAKSEFKYDGFKKVFHSDSDAELLARLIYSETLAANCDDKRTKIAPLIAEAIGNRVRIRGSDVKKVVFQRDQFASSFNIYGESRYRDLLCPKDLLLWKQAIDLATANGQPKSKASGLPPDTVNYYLYKHSPKFKAPSWALEEAKTDGASGIEDCVRFFRNPKWH